MNEILDKAFLFVCIVALYLPSFRGNYMMFPILLVLLFSALFIYNRNKIFQILLINIYFVLCYAITPLTLFLPVLMYEFFITRYYFIILVALYILNYNMNKLGSQIILLTFMFLLLSMYLKYRTHMHNKLRNVYHQTLNDSKELVLIEEEKNRSILENQDYEINIATLNERNRIAKEIHDHIGHLLSRSLIQIGALLTLEKNPLIKEELTSLKDSLSEGMDSIRTSIHNMHDESIDLYSVVLKLVKDFKFCDVEYHYDIISPLPLKVRYCFIAVTKEALNNIMKHSSATKVVIIFAEEPALYRLIIDDNGNTSEKEKALARRVLLSNEYISGIGLQNMNERVRGLNGNFQIIADKGFKIFITIPRENNGG